MNVAETERQWTRARMHALNMRAQDWIKEILKEITIKKVTRIF